MFCEQGRREVGAHLVSDAGRQAGERASERTQGRFVTCIHTPEPPASKSVFA